MKPEYPGYKEGSMFVAEDVKYLEAKEDYDLTKYQTEFLSILTAMEIIIVCSLCRTQKKIYHHLNESTFMQHVGEKHLNKLKQALVATCPVCKMEFNKVRTAEHHIQCNHKSNHTCKELKQLIKQMKDTADSSNAIDWTDNFWTTKLCEVECFASLGNSVRDCFTCSISALQNKSDLQKYPPPQFLPTRDDLATQVNQPNTCPMQYMTPDEFLPTPDKDIVLGWPNMFRSAYLTEDGKLKKM